MRYTYKIKNLDCANCAKKIEDALNKDKNINNAILNFATLKLSFDTNIKQAYTYVKNIVANIEPDVILYKEEESIVTKDHSIINLILGVFITLLAIFLDNIIFIIIGYFILCFNALKKAINLLIKSKTINENLLVTISAVGALILGETLEGMMVISLYELGKILEEKAVNKSRRMVSELLSINEEYANLKVGNKIDRVLSKDLKINDIIVVKKGEKIPVDGTVICGTTYLDTKALTGESKKTKVEVGNKVLSGSINTGDVMEIRVDVLYENSTVSKILNLVENATDKKAKRETIVSKYSKHYTIGVLILAILVSILLPLFTTNTLADSIYKGLTFLVISCPCAIAISVPLSYFASIGYASSRNILIKGSNYLDALKDIDEIIFDKTGTLTTGTFSVTTINVIDNSYSKKDILEYIAMGESFSNHLIAKSILDKVDFDIDTKEVKKYTEKEGMGISYQIEDKKIKIGNYKFVNYDDTNNDKIYLSINDKVVGNVIVSDTIKKDAKVVISKLHTLGIKTRIFSGDNKDVALSVSKKLNIDNVEYEMLPTDKYNRVEEIIKNKSNNKLVAFVGDGINDAPVLMLSDIGISMGNIGSDSAIEASDVVIMNDDLEKVVDAISISKRTNKIIIENLVFAIGTKLLVLILSIVGIASMWQAVFADVGVTVLAILNTLRLLKK